VEVDPPITQRDAEGRRLVEEALSHRGFWEFSSGKFQAEPRAFDLDEEN